MKPSKCYKWRLFTCQYNLLNSGQGTKMATGGKMKKKGEGEIFKCQEKKSHIRGWLNFTIRIYFLYPCAIMLGIEVVWSRVKTTVHGLLLGSPWIENSGDTLIVNQATFTYANNDVTHIVFIRGWIRVEIDQIRNRPSKKKRTGSDLKKLQSVIFSGKMPKMSSYLRYSNVF